MEISDNKPKSYKKRSGEVNAYSNYLPPSIAFHMQDTFYSTEKKVCAIIFCEPADPHSGKKALKYEHVHNSDTGMKTFLRFAKKFPTARYINFYSKKSRQYLGRKYL